LLLVIITAATATCCFSFSCLVLLLLGGGSSLALVALSLPLLVFTPSFTSFTSLLPVSTTVRLRIYSALPNLINILICHLLPQGMLPAFVPFTFLLCFLWPEISHAMPCHAPSY
jgi:ABC-type branched-subunit amino acid transport system permease subunit